MRLIRRTICLGALNRCDVLLLNLLCIITGLVVDRQNKLSREKMRDTIVSHIASAHCRRRTEYMRTCLSQSYKMQPCSSRDEDWEMTCDDFVRQTPLNDCEEQKNEVKILHKILGSVSSRKTLIRFLKCKDIPHDATKCIRHLRTCLQGYARLVEKSSIRSSEWRKSSSLRSHVSFLAKRRRLRCLQQHCYS
jgi:hypothetical protein